MKGPTKLPGRDTQFYGFLRYGTEEMVIRVIRVLSSKTEERST